MDNMENKGQGMVTSPSKDGLPPALWHKDKQEECWGFKIKGWWRKGDIRTTKTRKSFECWVKTISDVPTGTQKSLTETLTAPQYNVGKDAYTVDLEINKKVYCLVTESGLLGSFGFEGECGAGDGSCKPPTNSMGVVFCNFSVMQWNTTTPLPHVFLQEQRIRESSKVGREVEGLSSNRPELVVIREWSEGHDDHIDLLYLTDSEESLQAIHKWIHGGTKLNLSKSSDGDVLNLKTSYWNYRRGWKRGQRLYWSKSRTTGGTLEWGSRHQNRGRSSQGIQGNDLKWLVWQNCVSMTHHLHKTRGGNSSQDFGMDQYCTQLY